MKPVVNIGEVPGNLYDREILARTVKISSPGCSMVRQNVIQ